MADFFDPFGGVEKPKYVRVGDAKSGTTIMQSLGYITTRENTKDMQQAAREQARMIIIQGEAEREAAKRLGISEEDAAKDFAPTRDDFGNLVPAKLELRDFLSRDDLEELLTFQIDPEKKEKAATMMMRYRYAWAFVVEAADASAEELELAEPLKFLLSKGDRLRYEDKQGQSRYFVLTQDAMPLEKVLTIKPLKHGIDDEAIAIRQINGGDQVGWSDWSDEYSSRLRPNAKNLLYGFYMNEMSIYAFGGREDEGNEPEKSAKKRSKRTGSPKESTGSKSGSESNDLASLPVDSAA